MANNVVIGAHVANGGDAPKKFIDHGSIEQVDSYFRLLQNEKHLNDENKFKIESFLEENLILKHKLNEKEAELVSQKLIHETLIESGRKKGEENQVEIDKLNKVIDDQNLKYEEQSMKYNNLMKAFADQAEECRRLNEEIVELDENLHAKTQLVKGLEKKCAEDRIIWQKQKEVNDEQISI